MPPPQSQHPSLVAYQRFLAHEERLECERREQAEWSEGDGQSRKPPSIGAWHVAGGDTTNASTLSSRHDDMSSLSPPTAKARRGRSTSATPHAYSVRRRRKAPSVRPRVMLDRDAIAMVDSYISVGGESAMLLGLRRKPRDVHHLEQRSASARSRFAGATELLEQSSVVERSLLRPGKISYKDDTLLDALRTHGKYDSVLRQVLPKVKAERALPRHQVLGPLKDEMPSNVVGVRGEGRVTGAVGLAPIRTSSAGTGKGDGVGKGENEPSFLTTNIRDILQARSRVGGSGMGASGLSMLAGPEAVSVLGAVPATGVGAKSVQGERASTSLGIARGGSGADEDRVAGSAIRQLDKQVQDTRKRVSSAMMSSEKGRATLARNWYRSENTVGRRAETSIGGEWGGRSVPSVAGGPRAAATSMGVRNGDDGVSKYLTMDDVSDEEDVIDMLQAGDVMNVSSISTEQGHSMIAGDETTQRGKPHVSRGSQLVHQYAPAAEEDDEVSAVFAKAGLPRGHEVGDGRSDVFLNAAAAKAWAASIEGAAIAPGFLRLDIFDDRSFDVQSMDDMMCEGYSRRRRGTPAFSRWFETNGVWVWKPVLVHGVCRSQGLFVITWDHKPDAYKIAARLNVRFREEDPVLFCMRLKLAVEARAVQEAIMRYHSRISLMPVDKLPHVPLDTLDSVVHRVGDVMREVTEGDGAYKNIVYVFLEKVRNHYRWVLNKMDFDSRIPYLPAEQAEHILPNVVEVQPAPMSTMVYHTPSFKFAQVSAALVKKHYCASQRHLAIVHECYIHLLEMSEDTLLKPVVRRCNVDVDALVDLQRKAILDRVAFIQDRMLPQIEMIVSTALGAEMLTSPHVFEVGDPMGMQYRRIVRLLNEMYRVSLRELLLRSICAYEENLERYARTPLVRFLNHSKYMKSAWGIVKAGMPVESGCGVAHSLSQTPRVRLRSSSAVDLASMLEEDSGVMTEPVAGGDRVGALRGEGMGSRQASFSSRRGSRRGSQDGGRLSTLLLAEDRTASMIEIDRYGGTFEMEEAHASVVTEEGRLLASATVQGGVWRTPSSPGGELVPSATIAARVRDILRVSGSYDPAEDLMLQARATAEQPAYHNASSEHVAGRGSETSKRIEGMPDMGSSTAWMELASRQPAIKPLFTILVMFEGGKVHFNPPPSSVIGGVVQPIVDLLVNMTSLRMILIPSLHVDLDIMMSATGAAAAVNRRRSRSGSSMGMSGRLSGPNSRTPSFSSLVSLGGTSTNILEESFAEEEALVALRDDSVRAAEFCLSACRRFLGVFQPFLSYLSMDLEAHQMELMSESTALSDLTALVEQYGALHGEIEETIPREVSIGLLRIDAGAVIDQLLQRATDLRATVLQVVLNMANRDGEQIRSEVDAILATLDVIPDSPESVHAQHNYLMSLPWSLRNLQLRIGEVVQKYYVLEDFCFDVSEASMSHIWTSFALLRSVEVRSREAERALQVVRLRVIRELRDDVTELIAQSGELQRQAATLDSAADIDQAEVYSDKCKAIMADIVEIEKKQERYSTCEKLLEFAETQNPTLKDVRRSFEPVYDAWTLIGEWSIQYATWVGSPLSEISGPQLESTVNSFLDRSTSVLNMLERKRKSDGAVRALRDFKGIIASFLKFVPVILKLRHPGVRHRHWQALQRSGVCKGAISPAMTLSYLMQMGIDKEEAAVSVVVDAVIMEYGLEMTMERMMKQVRSWTLTISPYEDTGTYMLTDTDELFMELDHCVVSVSGMLASPAVEPMKQRVVLWRNQLVLLQETLDVWLGCQRQWLFLAPVFGAQDVRDQLVAESTKFEAVDANWRRVMRQFAGDPKISSMLGRDVYKNSFSDYVVLLEAVNKGLQAYLESKRDFFPRFRFLSIEELLAILSNLSNPRVTVRYLPKCFGNIANVRFGDDMEITHMISAQGEEVTLHEPVVTQGVAIEVWLSKLVTTMQISLRLILMRCMAGLLGSETSRSEWLLAYPGQLVQSAWQVEYCAQVSRVVAQDSVHMEAKGLRAIISELNSRLSLLMSLILKNASTSSARLLLGAVLTLEFHNKTIVQGVLDGVQGKEGGMTWDAQVRHYYEDDDCHIRMLHASRKYAFEYLGTTPRLVFTPLTDRCYQTLLAALTFFWGCAPQGPAGTGKSETCKDVARTVGKQIIIFNCSAELQFETMGGFFRGIAASGVWACFDEFNRIKIGVLSVVAQQLMTMRRAAMAGSDSLELDGSPLKLDPTYAICITMNPTYAGRSRLPDNLEAMFRPISMMVADYSLIAEIRLFAAGFSGATFLATIVVKCFKMCEQLLTRQTHYDFGMRTLNVVLQHCGELKQKQPNETEASLVVRALRDCNVSKFVEYDVPLFEGILKDLCPNPDEMIDAPLGDSIVSITGREPVRSVITAASANLPPARALSGSLQSVPSMRDLNEDNADAPPKIVGATGGATTDDSKTPHLMLRTAVRSVLRDAGYGAPSGFVAKVVQLYMMTGVRHGIMIVGADGVGKTILRRALQAALANLASSNSVDPLTGQFMPSIVQQLVNPKCVTINHLFGSFHPATHEWRDGVVPAAMRAVTEIAAPHVDLNPHGRRRSSLVQSTSSSLGAIDKKKVADGAVCDPVPSAKRKQGWIVLDGPVDSLWVESLNTVLDDSKTLFLMSGERIPLSDAMRMIFEVCDLSSASPATVSRCGMVYVESDVLSLDMKMSSWVDSILSGCLERCRDTACHLFSICVHPLLDYIIGSEHGQMVNPNEDSRRGNVRCMLPVSRWVFVSGVLRLFASLMQQLASVWIKSLK